MTGFLITRVLSVAFLAGVLQTDPDSPIVRASQGPADLILHAGRIWTGDPVAPVAQSLAARGEKIVAVGSREHVNQWRGDQTVVLDWKGSFATPGLIDAHGHLTSLGEALEQVDLRGARSIEQVIERVVKRAQDEPDTLWIQGHSWDQSLWPGGELPTHEPLSRALPDRPVWLRRIDGHAGWANAAAMSQAGVDAHTPDPPGGRILRDPNGQPTGVFLDAANHLITRQLPAATPALIRRQFIAAERQCLEAGLTSVHDAGLSGPEIEVLRGLDESGELKLRVYGMASPPGGREVGFVSEPPQRLHGRRFVLRAIKLFIDGAMGSRGGLLFEDYSDEPGNRGLLLTEPEHLEEITTAALEHGWQVCTHAIGDRGNRLVLDVYEASLQKVPVADPRLRIEHAQVVALEDIPRFARLGVIASMQPTHATTDKRWVHDRVGPQRIAGAYAWRRFLNGGVRLAFGSDFPVEQAPPALGLYAAVTRQDLDGQPPGGWLPDQVLTVDEALRAFTAGSAYAEFAEGDRGVLRPGMTCDVTVFNCDLSSIAPREIARAGVLATLIAGEVCHKMPD